MIRGRADDGSATLELAIATPVLILVLLLVVFLGRLSETRALVDGAARDAARAASLERSAERARAEATRAARATLAAERITCSQLRVDVDTSRFTPGGSVAVTVRCTINNRDLSLLRAGNRTLTGRIVAPVDLYRGVGP